jgi:hypothetical protein
MKIPYASLASIGVLSVTAALVGRAAPPQHGALGGAVIQGCEIDIRPAERLEAQIYYQELPAGGAPQGTTFDIHVTMGDRLEVSNWDASEPAVKLKAGGPNTVRLEIDASASPVKAWLKILDPAGAVKLNKETRYQGQYDPLALFVDPPTVTTVLHPSPDKGRIRITSTTRGMSISFTLSDA